MLPLLKLLSPLRPALDLGLFGIGELLDNRSADLLAHVTVVVEENGWQSVLLVKTAQHRQGRLQNVAFNVDDVGGRAFFLRDLQLGLLDIQEAALELFTHIVVRRGVVGNPGTEQFLEVRLPREDISLAHEFRQGFGRVELL